MGQDNPRQAAGQVGIGGLPRIVLAHGTIQGFGVSWQDEEEDSGTVNWIDLSRFPHEEIDYVALGDWHGTKQVGPNAWYSGTPEIDRFPKGGGNTPGNLLSVTVSRRGVPVVETIPSGRFRWREFSFRFSDDASLELFARQLDELFGHQGDEHLLLLTLEGSLSLEASGSLETLLESWESRLLRLKLDHRVITAPSQEEITTLTRRAENPLIASVAAQLVADLDGDGGDIARIALRELHTACLA
ncbi:MAG: hypothetical protein EOP86_25890 [Verrucomicrobiaceae bacterium]|nr:MAG: hypothetical protein EOP86_25890 [Verrucomicrobiaceae bacterium]